MSVTGLLRAWGFVGQSVDSFSSDCIGEMHTASRVFDRAIGWLVAVPVVALLATAAAWYLIYLWSLARSEAMRWEAEWHVWAGGRLRRLALALLTRGDRATAAAALQQQEEEGGGSVAAAAGGGSSMLALPAPSGGGKDSAFGSGVGAGSLAAALGGSASAVDPLALPPPPPSLLLPGRTTSSNRTGAAVTLAASNASDRFPATTPSSVRRSSAAGGLPFRAPSSGVAAAVRPANTNTTATQQQQGAALGFRSDPRGDIVTLLGSFLGVEFTPALDTDLNIEEAGTAAAAGGATTAAAAAADDGGASGKPPLREPSFSPQRSSSFALTAAGAAAAAPVLPAAEALIVESDRDRQLQRQLARFGRPSDAPWGVRDEGEFFDYWVATALVVFFFMCA